MKYVQKTFLEGVFMCARSFLVCARLTACVHSHTSRGTLSVTAFFVLDLSSCAGTVLCPDRKNRVS